MDRLCVFLLFSLMFAACIEARRRPPPPPKFGKKCPLTKCIKDFHKKLGKPVPGIPKPGSPKPDMLIEGLEKIVDGALGGDMEVAIEVPTDICNATVQDLLSCVEEVKSTNSMKSVCGCGPRVLMPLIKAKEFPLAFMMKSCKIPAPHCEAHVDHVKGCALKMKEAKKAIKEYAMFPVTERPLDVAMTIEDALRCIEDLHKDLEDECKVKFPLMRIRPMLVFSMIFIKSLGCEIPRPCIPRKPICDPIEEDVDENECYRAANNSACGMIEEFPSAVNEVLLLLREKKCDVQREVLFYKHEMGCDVDLPIESILLDVDTDVDTKVIMKRAKGRGKSESEDSESDEESDSASMTTPDTAPEQSTTPSSAPSKRSMKILAKLLKRLLEN